MLKNEATSAKLTTNIKIYYFGFNIEHYMYIIIMYICTYLCMYRGVRMYICI